MINALTGVIPASGGDALIHGKLSRSLTLQLSVLAVVAHALSQLH